MSRLRLPVCALVILLTAPLCSAVTLYVSPGGNDAWSGRAPRANAAKTDGPLASLQGARDAVRKLKAAPPPAEPVTVEIAAGTYPLLEPVVFGPPDTGTKAAPITYKAASGAKPIFSAGRRLPAFREGPGGLWVCSIPQVAAGDWYFEQLWVNGRRATRAHEPDQFYYYVTDGVAGGLDAAGKPVDLSRSAFRGRPEDLAPLQGLSPQQLNDTNIICFFSWESSRSRIAAFDPQKNSVQFTGGAPWPLNYWGANLRYQIENIKSGLDEPGEWFLDRDGTLYYKPLPGERLAQAEAVAPINSEFLRLGGQVDLGLPLEYLTFSGLSFQHGQYLLPPEGHGDGQAEVTIPATIMLDGVRNITFSDCEIKHAGLYAMWFRRACRDCRVERTLMEDLGGGGIKIGEGWGVDLQDPLFHTAGIVCDNNIVHSGGRMHHGSHGFWIGHSGGNQLTHNDISDLFYSGISAGWSWGYNPTISHNNKIEFNHIHHLGWGVLSDMGGVYTLGLADGTTVSNNVIHDVYSYDKFGAGGWGLYNDEGSSRITMENNLVYNTKTGTYHQHYGEDNLVRNNILAYSMNGQLQRSRPEEHNSFNFENNIVYWKSGPLLNGNWRNLYMTTRNNLYWLTSGEPVMFHEFDLPQWQQKGQEIGSVVADPGFVDPERGDFHLKADSPALKIGFKPFDYSRAGVYGAAAWTALPKSYRYAAVQFAPDPPPPPPLVVEDDFETTPAGGRPSGARTVNVEGKGDQIRVSDQLGAGGSKQCLEVLDAPGLQYEYDPHFAYHPAYTGGTTTCSFDLRLEPTTSMYHEWRSWDVNPYVVGPTLTIKEGKLQLPGKEPIALPAGQWLHFQVSAGVGSEANGKWQLALTLPGQQAQTYELATGSPKFANLTWVGFSSTATDKTAYYLDNMKLSNTPK